MTTTIPKTDAAALRENLRKFDQETKKKSNKYKKKEKDQRVYNTFINMDADYYASIIRFLPPAEGDSLFFARGMYHKHRLLKSRFMNDECAAFLDPNTPCAVCDKVKAEWKNWSPETQKLMKRKMWYVSNIYIVTDPQHPELEGKVMLFRYTKEIFDKIMAKFNPSNSIDKPSDIFDYINGRNFKLKITLQGLFWQYDTSEFDDVSPLCSGDATLINDIHQKIYSLGSYIEEVKASIDYTEVKAAVDFLFKPVDTEEENDLPYGEESHMSTAESKAPAKPVTTSTVAAPIAKVEVPVAVTPQAVVAKPAAQPAVKSQPAANNDDDFFNNL